MDATQVGVKARAGFKQAISTKPKIGYGKAAEVAANARKAFKR